MHDEDAVQILKALLQLTEKIDLLRFTPDARAMGRLYWEKFLDANRKTLLGHQLKSAGTILEVFPETKEFDYLLAEIKGLLNPKTQNDD